MNGYRNGAGRIHLVLSRSNIQVAQCARVGKGETFV